MDEIKKKYIEETLEEYLKENEVVVSNEEKNEIIDTLISCNYTASEKGGIIAIRGFIYQYLVTIYYMLSVATGKIDWDYIVYELGDDVALIKDNKICFCQVKTKMDKGEYINFTINGDLTKRNKRLDSWLDKLFLNTNRIKNKMISVGIQPKGNIDASYRLIINTVYNSEAEIAPYCEGSTKIDKENKILNNLKSIKEVGDIKYNLDDLLDTSIEKCIENFNIVTLGGYSGLFNTNISLVSNLIRDNDIEVGKRVVEQLTTFLLLGTHNDNLEDKEEKSKFIFNKEQFIEIIKEKENVVRNEIEQNRKKKIVSTTFDEAFTIIQQEFDRDYKSVLRDELIRTMLWLKNSLLEKVKEDGYIYEKFINRVFLLENSKIPCLDLANPLDKYDLTKAIKNIIMYMTFYSNRIVMNDNTINFYVNCGIYNSEMNYLTTYSSRQRKTEIESIAYIYSNIENCPYLNTLSEEIVCFLLDYKEEEVLDEWGLNCGQKIVETDEEFTIVSKPENIKFCRINKLDNFIDAIERGITNKSIPTNTKFSPADVWDRYLTKNIRSK